WIPQTAGRSASPVRRSQRPEGVAGREREDVRYRSETTGQFKMKYILLGLAILGIAASALALREHYRTYGEAPCDINDRWDCGIVNHSPYAVFPHSKPHGVPVAVIGIAGYLLLGILALKRVYWVMLALAIPALAFSL